MSVEMRKLEAELVKVVKTQKQLSQQWDQVAVLLTKVLKGINQK